MEEKMTPITRREKYLAKSAGQEVETPAPVTREEFFLDAIAKGGGGSSLPSVSASDNGKVLGVVDGAWAASEQGKKFIVTLTPTALDYSGEMDKTETEISDAYEAGQQIVFRVTGIPGYDYVDVNVTEALYYTDVSRWQMSAYLIMLPSTLIYIYNNLTGDGDSARYSTRIYSLTPAS